VYGRTSRRPWSTRPSRSGAGGRRDDYVSRGGHKLAGALAAFPELGVAGRRCLDAGASTGGFTDVLLRRGAAAVIAVDVGYGQLAWPLRNDSRVTVLERTNVRSLTPEQIGGPVDLTVADLSFISLRLVLPALAACTRPEGDLVPMVKPQFEVGRERVGAGGVVREPALRAGAVLDVAAAAVGLGLGVAGVAVSPLPGPSGNVEFFLWLRRGAPPADPAHGSRPRRRCPVSRIALLVTHTGRKDSTAHARTVARDMIEAGFTVR
jgi:23S rRNA (cytidine1920-2'-O)/16S rRNA (cytidine1409-2'-O)-methyltransferase